MSINKPSRAEEEYFAREEAEKKRQLAFEATQSLATADRTRLRDLHYMHCPKCGLLMQELTLSGVVVERCFNCHGIYLDERDVQKLAADQGYWARMLHFFARRDYGADADET